MSTTPEIVERAEKAVEALRNDERTVDVFADEPMSWIELLTAAKEAVKYSGSSLAESTLLGLKNVVESMSDVVLEYAADEDDEDDDQ